ncbi:MAG: hypothetical protein R8M37_04200 [Alphaproteobacteria bacterium]|nr:hypothetical protein [Alphaproteobacteria bacterium]
MDFSRDWFFGLDARLRAAGLDSDAQSFDEILENLKSRRIYTPDEFASHCAYVILAGGFSQQTAKRIHEKIMNQVRMSGADFDTLIQIFNNKNKIRAICKIWENRHCFCTDYYKLNLLDDKLKYLQSLPHIGKITANHLARNLGEDIVKYDIWIQRLGCVFAGKDLSIDNGKLLPEIKSACDDMFAHLVGQTGLPRGYIDVVLWKSCQVKLISVDDYLHKPPVM